MRLFIAILLSERVKDALVCAQEELRVRCPRANWTRPENMHVTLAFLGEVSPKRFPALTALMDGLPFTSFELTVQGIGAFKRPGGDVLWAGVCAPPELTRLHADLTSALREAGFPADDRLFTPHLTLARGTHGAPPDGFRLATPPITVDGISLMESFRENGRLVYAQRHRAGM